MPYEAITYFKHGDEEFEKGDPVSDEVVKALEETPFSAQYVRHNNQAPSSGTMMLASDDTESLAPVPGADTKIAVEKLEEDPDAKPRDLLLAAAAESEGTAEENPAGDEPQQSEEPEGVQATDGALREADERGIDITTVEGTGQGGKVTVDDVKRADQEQSS